MVIVPLQFKVKLLGYNETCDSWEPWSALRDMVQLQVNYLMQVNLPHLIPKRFKDNYMLKIVHKYP